MKGEQAKQQWEVARPHAEQYADLVGAKLIVRDEEPDVRHPLLTKVRLVREALKYYDRILFVDSDVLFGPESPNLFALTPPTAIGIREEIFESWPDAAEALTQGLGDLFKAATIDRNPRMYPHYNTGVMIVPKCWSSIFIDPTFEMPKHHCAEQDWLRYQIHSSGCEVFKFDPKHVGIWATDHRGKFARSKTVKHFAGAPARDRQMEVDVLRWSEGKPSGREAIVVGHFGIPGAVRFQLALNKRHLNVPMLVTDDWTWESKRANETDVDGRRRHKELIDACYWGGAHLRTVSETSRCKHAGGDLGAFYHGLIWAAEHGIEYIMKLSMRAFVFGIDKYLQQTVDLMAKYNYQTATHVCQYGDNKTYYLARTEIVVMHVPTWCQPNILTQLTPRPNVGAAEDIIADIVSKNLTQRMLGPHWFGPDRRTKYPNLHWHDNYYGPTPELDYKAAKEGEKIARDLAATYQVDLGDEYHARVSGAPDDTGTPGYIGW